MGGPPFHTRPDRGPPHKAVQLSDWLLSPKFQTVQKPDPEPSGLESANPESQPHFQPVGGDDSDTTQAAGGGMELKLELKPTTDNTDGCSIKAALTVLTF